MSWIDGTSVNIFRMSWSDKAPLNIFELSWILLEVIEQHWNELENKAVLKTVLNTFEMSLSEEAPLHSSGMSYNDKECLWNELEWQSYMEHFSDVLEWWSSIEQVTKV